MMKVEQWSAEMETGIVWQDSQHANLLAKIAFLQQVIIARKGRKQVKQIFDFLEEYIVYHFEDEEKHMEGLDYPEKETHLREHQTFINELVSLKGVHEKQTDAASMSLFIFLNEWVINHIKTHDKRLGLFLQMNGTQ